MSNTRQPLSSTSPVEMRVKAPLAVGMIRVQSPSARTMAARSGSAIAAASACVLEVSSEGSAAAPLAVSRRASGNRPAAAMRSISAPISVRAGRVSAGPERSDRSAVRPRSGAPLANPAIRASAAMQAAAKNRNVEVMTARPAFRRSALEPRSGSSLRHCCVAIQNQPARACAHAHRDCASARGTDRLHQSP